METIHQYTSIDCLALILKNRTIRFKRLDKMDDIEEAALTSKGVHLGGFMFVSCWTYSEKESIPLWKMYTPSTKGVRISLEKEMFKKHIVDLKEMGRHNIIDTEGKQIVTSIIPVNKMFNPKYTILNIFWDDDFFYKKIEYTENTDAIYNSLITDTQEGGANLNFSNIGAFKHTHWNFQDECRFRLIIFPNNNLDVNNEQYADYVLNCLQKETFPTIDSYYVDLKDNIFDNLKITLSPYATESDLLIVNALCDKYAPNAQIIDSVLKNKIRL